ncbi:MAG: Smr/MutS family protein [Bacilli bacterium]
MLLFEHVPELDLHGTDRDYARFLTKEFINDNYKLRKERLLIIHGKGTGIIKQTVHEVLAKDKRVLKYQLDLFNTGCTIVYLKRTS